MTTVDRTRNCPLCGIQVKLHWTRCVVCSTRLSGPSSLQTIDDVYEVFSLGGMQEIATAMHSGAIPWDAGDKEYQSVLEVAAAMALTELMASMDFIFYWKHPVHGCPYIGVKWPESALVEGIRLSLHDDLKEFLFTILPRPDEGSKLRRGMNIRFDRDLDPRMYQASISVYSEFVIAKRLWKVIHSTSKRLIPTESAGTDGVHEVDWTVPVS